MKRFPRLGMRSIARTVDDWRGGLGSPPLALVMTYPYYLHLRDRVRPDTTVYYNIDDYALYWPSKADEVRSLERQAVRESDLTVCVSRRRAEWLRAENPDRADRVHHLPHGSPSWLIADEPWSEPAPAPPDMAHLPRPLLGYVGTMEDRVDWRLLARLADEFPGGSLVLVGRPPVTGRRPDAWVADYRECRQRPNVHALGWRTQAELLDIFACFDVGLIPYREDHPFNQVCCPTKIMDGMGCGRPMVSTDLPECRQYAALIDVASGHDAFVAAVRSLLSSGPDDGRSHARHSHALHHTCAAVAERLLDLIAP
jgi:glycosyltransferase involved in cell wall biosynthesis